MDYVVLGILQARILEWVAYPFSRGSFQLRNWTEVSCTAGGFSTNRAIGEAPTLSNWKLINPSCTFLNFYFYFLVWFPLYSSILVSILPFWICSYFFLQPWLLKFRCLFLFLFFPWWASFGPVVFHFVWIWVKISCAKWELLFFWSHIILFWTQLPVDGRNWWMESSSCNHLY